MQTNLTTENSLYRIDEQSAILIETPSARVSRNADEAVGHVEIGLEYVNRDHNDRGKIS